MAELRKYGASGTITFPLITVSGGTFTTGAVFATAGGDVKISKSGAAFANAANNPTHVGLGMYQLALTASELTTTRVAVVVKDQTSPRVWEPQAILVDTYGNASAQHAFDLDSASVTVGTNNDKTGYTLASGAAVWSAATRTLTSGGVVSDSVWVETARTLTSGATVASSVWAAAARTLTSAGVAWTAAARTLTSGGAVSDSVWVETARTITSAGVVWTASPRTLSATGVDQVWDEDIVAAHSTVNTGGLILSQLTKRSITFASQVVQGSALRQLADDGTATFDRTTESLQAFRDSVATVSGVWSAATRTLTSAGVAGTAAARTLTSGATVGNSVWVSTTRTLTSGGNVASSVWSKTITEVTGVPAAAPAAKASLGFLYVSARNKRITTATGDKIHNSASTLIARAALSYVTGTQTFTKAKYSTAT